MFKINQEISGNVVDPLNFRIFPGTLKIIDGRIIEIQEDSAEYDTYIIPGLVDAHIHIESSMMVPSEFARMAVIHGTVATVSDPHEISNVLGIRGIRYMIANGKKVPFKFYFGAPPCVPATGFECSGAQISAIEIQTLFRKDRLKYLSEMMNFPGVLTDDLQVKEKIKLAQNFGKPIDGHAPGLQGTELQKYVQAGISTDHEAYSFEEGLAKVRAGMKILIREGSAAKNFAELHPLLRDYSNQCMFCCDDKHPNDLVKGHIDEIVKAAFQLGYDKLKVLQCATVNPVKHYGLEVGLLQKGDPADFVVINNFEEFRILRTYINGRLIAENGRCLISKPHTGIINRFNVKSKKVGDFAVTAQPGKMNVIAAIDGELITRKIEVIPAIVNGQAVADPERDIAKITVINRYRNLPPAVAFIKNFGIRKGAIASSVAHDSHNIIAVGVSDQDIAQAVNLVIHNKGGLTLVNGKHQMVLPLPVAGLMSKADGFLVAQQYEEIARYVKEVLGSTLRDPYMTLSFMALLVIPDLKLSDCGLFDGKKFQFINLFE